MRIESDEPVARPLAGPPDSQSLLDDLRLRDIYAIARMQWRLIASVVLAAFVLALVHSVVATRIYAATASIHLSTVTGQELKVEKVVDKDVYNRLDRKIFTQTQIEIIESRTLREDVVRRYNGLDYHDLEGAGGAGALLSKMSVRARRNSELIDVTITHRDPERAAVLANLIAETYRELNLQAVRDSAVEARNWLDDQLSEYEDAIRQAARDKLAYQAENNMADADQSATTLSDQLASLNTAYGDVSTERVQLEAAVRSHQTLLSAGSYDGLAKELPTPLITRLNEKYGSVVTEAAAVKARYGTKHPERQRVDAEVEAIASALRTEVQRQVQAEKGALAGLEEREQGLAAEIATAKELLLSWHERHEAYEKLAMALERHKGLYEKLSTRKHELDFVASTHLNNVRVVDAAVVVDTPVKPEVMRNLFVSVSGALVFGLILGILREWVDDTVASQFDVQAWLGVPALGLIPVLEGQTAEAPALHTFENPTGAAAEAMRGVRTVLEMSPAGETLGRLVVTSAQAGEGKTSLSVWLGVAFAHLGRRVVVVDCDLRRPRLHKIFNVPREGGVTDVLTGESDRPTVHATAVPGLCVVTAGPRSPRAVELIGTERMQVLLRALEEDADLVIVDTPPAGIVSDASVLSRAVDGVVFVIRAHTVRRNASRAALHALALVNAKVLGVVVNAVDPRRGRANDYYGYGYGYRYTRYDEDGDVSGAATK